MDLDVPGWVSKYFSWLLPKKILGLYRFIHVLSQDEDFEWIQLHQVTRAADQELVHQCLSCLRCQGQREFATAEEEHVWRAFHTQCQEESHVHEDLSGEDGTDQA